jgi:hypothetical protein
MIKIIFVSGLDYRSGDLSVSQQVDLIKKGFPGATIISHRWSVATSEVTTSINNNRDASVILFSAGCSKSKAIAQFMKGLNLPLNRLYINEPYTVSTNTYNVVTAAISLGVPSKNVFSGGSQATGSNVPGASNLSGRVGHFQSLTPLGSLLAGTTQAQPAPAVATSNPPATNTNPPRNQTPSTYSANPGAASNQRLTTLVCAYRSYYDGMGASKVENQVSNAKKLIDLQFDMIHLDVQITKDGLPVLFDDEELDFKTTGTGKISNKTWDELKSVKYKKEAVGISRLDEVLIYVREKKAKTIIQLDKCDETEISKINSLGLFKGIEKNILCKKSSFKKPDVVGSADLLYMPIITVSYVGKMNSMSVIDEIVENCKGSNYLELQFSDSDTLLIDGTLSKKLEAIGCKLLVVAVGPFNKLGASFRGDTQNQWSKMVNPMGAGVIMTNFPTSLKNFLKTTTPIDLNTSTETLETGVTTVLTTPATPADVLSPSVEPAPVISQDNSRGNAFAENQKPPSSFDVGQIQKLAKIFDPTIKPTTIGFDFSGPGDNLSPNDLEHIQSDMGVRPLVYFYGVPIAYSDVRKLTLFHQGILPRIELVFVDSFGIFKEDGHPPDNVIITIFINSRSNNLRSILMDFKILSFQDNNEGSYTIVGSCDVPELYLKRFKSYKDKTSWETLQEVAKECELGFSSNVKNSNDKMTYINPGYMVKDFIQSTIENSYISDKSFQYCYIDFYYHLCYMDIYSEMERDNSQDQQIDTEIVAEKKIDDKKESTDDTSLSPLFLSTEKSLKDTGSFVQTFEIINQSTKISINKAYRMKTKFYDSLNKFLGIFNIESQTSDGSKTLILKSTPTKEGDKFFQENTQSVWLGKQEDSNVHKNYQYSSIQNKQNLDDITKLSAKLYLPNNNFNLHIYQKVKVIFIPQNPAAAEQIFFKRITGDWLIIDMEFRYQGNDFYQVLTVIKRELGLLPDEYGKFPQKATNSTAQNNYKQYPNELAPSDTPYTQPDIVETEASLTTNIEPTPTTPIIEPVSNFDSKSDFLLWLYLAWQQGPSGAAQHYRVSQGKRSYKIKEENIRENWPSGAVSSNGVKSSDISSLYKSDQKKLATAFIDVWRTTVSKKGSQGISTINSSKSNRSGVPYSVIKDAFIKYAMPEKGLTFEVITTFGMIENGLQTDTKDSATFQTMFQMNKEYPDFLSIIEQSKKGVSSYKSNFVEYDINILTKLAAPQMLIAYQSFVKNSGYTPATSPNPVQASPPPTLAGTQQITSPGLVNIVIGDSQTPAVAKNSGKFKLFGSSEGQSSLWKVGAGLKWLKDALVTQQPYTAAKNVAICIGTNGGFNPNDNVAGLVSEARRVFPNAKLFVVKGSWGWGGNKGISEQKVNNYYSIFQTQNVDIIPTPIGVTENHPTASTPSFKKIGGELDSSAIA